MNCKQCAFNNLDLKECGILIQRQSPCWAGCYTVEELSDRYSDIFAYSGTGNANAIQKEYEKFRQNLVKLKKVS